MADQDTLAQAAEEVGLALAPLEGAMESPENFAAFMRVLGWDLASIPDPIRGIGSVLTRLVDLLNAGDVDAASVKAVIDSIRDVLNVVEALSSQPAGAFPPSVDAAEFTANFPRQLVDYLVAEYLLRQHPPFGQVLRVIGVIRIEEVAAAGKRPAYVKESIAWEDLARAFSDPRAVFVDAWQWGSPAFQQEAFLRSIADLVNEFGLTSYLELLDPVIRDALSGGAPGPDPIHDWVLRVPLIGVPVSEAEIEVGIGAFMLPPTPAGGPGFAILPYARGSDVVEIALTENVSFVLEASFDLEGGVALLVHPDRPPELLIEIVASAGTGPKSATQISVGLVATSGTPIVLVGSTEGSHLEIGTASIKSGARLTSAGKLDVFGELALNSGRIVIKPAPGDADGFIAKLLPADGITADFDFGLGLSTHQGFYFSGSSGLEIEVPAHVSLGPLEISSARLRIKPAAGEIPMELGASFAANLGPLAASVENVGLRVIATFPADRHGNLGALDVSLSLKPPNGVGLAINAGVVQGGGFLYIDVDRGEYAGFLELVVADFLNLHAIGLITTKMPDGSPGFSLLVIITAEFGSGIQLGFGFTLIAVGGLLGLNRTMLFQPIMDGVRSGAINSIMFPHDVVANAPRILSDLKAIFPPHEGTFLIGPMAKLGWGTPTLVSLSLGVIIEIPPGDIAILGVLQLALPDPDDILILIQVNFAGALEFSKKRLYFFASMFDSRVLFITIDGEMGVLVAYGDDANFLVLVGGCHPRFKPPPLPFPSPHRIQISILNESYARIRCDAYFAVTTNTVQFGSHAELFFGFDAVSVEGHIGFDALVQFSPFHFIVTASGGVALKVFGTGVFGIDIDLLLEGPTPWHAHGTASISFLFFSIGVTIDFTWGDARQTALPPIAVMALVVAEFQKDANWRAILPSSSNLFVSLRKLDASESDFVLHPVGTLHVSQRLIPLDLTLDKVGNQKPSDANRFSLSVSPNGLAKRGDLFESFAPAQFKDFGDADKLSQAAFQPQHAGIELSAGSDLGSGTAVTRIVRYNLTVVDTKYRQYAQKFFVLVGSLFEHFLKGASVTRCDVSAYRQSQVRPFKDQVTVSAETFAVAYRSNNTAYADGVATFSSQAAATDYLQREVDRDPILKESLHVLPRFELVA